MSEALKAFHVENLVVVAKTAEEATALFNARVFGKEPTLCAKHISKALCSKLAEGLLSPTRTLYYFSRPYINPLSKSSRNELSIPIKISKIIEDFGEGIYLLADYVNLGDRSCYEVRFPRKAQKFREAFGLSKTQTLIVISKTSEGVEEAKAYLYYYVKHCPEVSSLVSNLGNVDYVVFRESKRLRKRYIYEKGLGVSTVCYRR